MTEGSSSRCAEQNPASSDGTAICPQTGEESNISMELFNSALGKNITFVRPAYFIISGFIGIPDVKFYYFFCLFVFIVSVLANSAVITVIYLDHHLRTPKYIAIFSLALADLLNCCALVPKVLDIFLFNNKHISYNDCMAFLFFCYVCTAMQALNLVALAYDRVIAILYPLHYHVKVTNKFMFCLLSFFWIFSIFAVLILNGLLTRLSFCQSVVITSFFCDHGQIYRLACNDKSPSFIISIILPGLILWLPLALILCSYIVIVYALSKIATVKERLKALKTCIAHVLLVTMFFLPIIITYTTMGKMPINLRIINLSLAQILPSMLDPIIYVLQTEEIKESLKKLLRKKLHKITNQKIATM